MSLKYSILMFLFQMKISH